ncbi:vascular cell adhesion protein 1 [Melospiza georgiana]|uniref:vascular cell adhesion protein 1 n=1 Tax=Melospiza georgiana TaxID=44398 RepID=UPI0025AB66AE|nr:vascular cell adhesion protein 1 [Melospiza georgiana]XP_057885882.1 vascular cell adhesion protein 1 [Melospiza georgiana]XP_057885883.1 vascular cell adhesion protein 1 [Melospiza georgiana]
MNKGTAELLLQQQLQMFKEMGRASQAVLLILCVLRTVKAFEMEIIPAERIVAQIGGTLILTCNTTGCASPSFSWRTLMDSPLGGKVRNHRTYSTLTMNPVGVVNSHSYLCTVICGERGKKEKSVKVELYSFPSDPIIDISPSLVAGEPAPVICKIPDVYPSHHLEVLLKKDGQVLHEEYFLYDDSTNTETKTVTYTFHPMAEDAGKEITCVARLPIADMDFEPKERTSSQKLNVNFGPQNTVITASPSNSPMEGDSLNLTCVTQSNPPAQIVWSKSLAEESIQHLIKNNVLFIPRVRFNDSGRYICEVINLVTNKTEEATVNLVIQGAPVITELSIEPSTTVQEGQNVSIQCSAESNPPPKIILRRKSDNADIGTSSARSIFLPSVMFQNGGDYECVAENKYGNSKSEITLNVKYGPKNTMITVFPAALKEGETVTMKCTSSGNPAPVISWKKKKATGESEKISKNATITIHNLKSQDLGLYECEAYNQFGKEEKAVELYVQARLEEPDQMIPFIIAFSSVAAVAVPAAAILIYVSRQAKINGSYSLVKALRLKV